VEHPGTIVVRDQGSPLSAQALAALRVRHARSAVQGQAPLGYGLGLSIVQTIASRHGGALVLRSPPPGQSCGLEARIELASPASAEL
jgi:two-component system, OmpR family, sensor kinase